MTKRDGFTLIELIVVISIISILSAYSINRYNSVSQSAKVSEDLHKISVFLKSKKLRAFTIKEEIEIKINANGDAISASIINASGTNIPDGSIELNNAIQPVNTTININSRGLYPSTGGKIYFTDTNVIAAYTCVKISPARIRKGEWNSNTSECDVK